MINKEKEFLKNISNECTDRDFEFNKLRSEITLLKETMEWEQFYSGTFVTSKVKAYINEKLFDFENYDYKIDGILIIFDANGDTWNTIDIKTYLLNSNKERLKFGNNWCRTTITQNCAPDAGPETSLPMTGYAKSKYNDLVVGYGLDANDGEDGLRMVMELIPAFTSRGTRSLIYSADLSSNSIWRQQFYNYRGTLVNANNSLNNVTGIEFYNNNNMVFSPDLSYIRIYRRKGGYKKFAHKG